MQHEMSFVVTDELSQGAVRRIAFAFARGRLGFALVFCVAIAAYSFIAHPAERLGGVGVGFMAAICSLLVFSFRNLSASLARLKGWEIHFKVTDDGCSLRTPKSAVDFTWGSVTRLRRFGSAWIFWSPGMNVVVPIPTTLFPPEVQAFVIDRVTAAGGHVIAERSDGQK